MKIYVNQTAKSKKTKSIKKHERQQAKKHSDSGRPTKNTPDQMLNPSHAEADKIFYSKVVNVTHNISRPKNVSMANFTTALHRDLVYIPL